MSIDVACTAASFSGNYSTFLSLVSVIFCAPSFSECHSHVIIPHNNLKLLSQHNGGGAVLTAFFSRIDCTGPKFSPSYYLPASDYPFPWNRRLFNTLYCQVGLGETVTRRNKHLSNEQDCLNWKWIWSVRFLLKILISMETWISWHPQLRHKNITSTHPNSSSSYILYYQVIFCVCISSALFQRLFVWFFCFLPINMLGECGKFVGIRILSIFVWSLWPLEPSSLN